MNDDTYALGRRPLARVSALDEAAAQHMRGLLEASAANPRDAARIAYPPSLDRDRVDVVALEDPLERGLDIDQRAASENLLRARRIQIADGGDLPSLAGCEVAKEIRAPISGTHDRDAQRAGCASA